MTGSLRQSLAGVPGPPGAFESYAVCHTTNAALTHPNPVPLRSGKELTLTEFLHSLHLLQIKQLKEKPISRSIRGLGGRKTG